MRAVFLAGALAIGRAAPALAYQDPGQERVDRTAYTLRDDEWSLGVLRAQYGVFDELHAGSYVLPWLAFPVTGSPIPTAFVKVRDWFAAPVAVSFRATVGYLDADNLSSSLLDGGEGDAGIWFLPLDAAVSYRASQAFSQSLELSYVYLRASGELPSETRVAGAAAASSLTLSALSELRLSRVAALTLLGRALVASQPLRVEAEVSAEDTVVDANLGGQLNDGFLWCVVPGLSLSWEHANLELGLGYGSNWIPAIELPIARRTLVPLLDFYFRF